jgi:peptidoglycan/LPS O-acetylase OafA/YrhL
MTEYGLDTPDQSLVPHVPVLLLYGSQFGLGWFLHRQPDLIRTFDRHWAVHLVLAVIMTVPVMYFASSRPGPGEEWPVWNELAANAAYALMMWLWISGSVGAIVRYFDRPWPAWRYVADSSYWLYIIHLPFVVWLQVAVAPFDLHWTVKLLVILAIVSPLLFLSYHLLVRSTFIGVMLNGRKYPLTWWPFGAVPGRFSAGDSSGRTVDHQGRLGHLSGGKKES